MDGVSVGLGVMVGEGGVGGTAAWLAVRMSLGRLMPSGHAASAGPGMTDRPPSATVNTRNSAGPSLVAATMAPPSPVQASDGAGPHSAPG